MRQVAKKGVRFAFASVALVGAFAFLGGCSSEDPTAQTTQEAGPSCPSTFALANGEACVGVATECYYAVQCSPVVQQAICKCEDGKFACEDPNGPIDVGAEPACSRRPPPASDTCPQSREQAEGRSCKSAGQQCFYQGETCPNNQATVRDVCQCMASPEDSTKFVFRCESGSCTP